MKRTILLLFACAALGVAKSALADGEDPVPNPPVPVDVHELFVPVGFDSNDEAVAVAYGYLPGTCYKTSHATVKYNQATKSFEITQYARKVHSVCLEMLVPFTTVIPLGVQTPGTYHVKSHGASDELLAVKPAASATVDDFLYVPVTSAHVERDPSNERYVSVIDGVYTNTCMAWGEAKVTDHGKTIEVMPIMASMEGGPDCQFKERPFEERVPLPESLTPGYHLLHVRSLNGTSVSIVFPVAA